MALGIVLLLASWMIGPWALLGFLLFLRPGLRPVHPWRVLGVGVLAAGLLVGVVLIPQSGRFGIPTGIGVLTSPGYEGRPALTRPLEVAALPAHPHLAPSGRNSMHNDAAATDAYAGPGPVGNQPRVRTAWYGVKECATLTFQRDGDIVGLCGDRTGPTLALIDPQTMRLRTQRRLPPRPDIGGSALQNICGGAYSYLDARDRAVVATSDRTISVFGPTLRSLDTWSVESEVPATDCLIALMPDWAGNVWFASKGGVVGFVEPRTGKVISRSLGEGVYNSFAADESGVYVVSDRALYKFAAAPGRIGQVWRSRYDRGSHQKPGQLSQGSGTTPTLLTNGTVAITDNADPQMHVVMINAETGSRVCSASVFPDEASATENSLVGLGDAVVVENNHGYRGPWSTMLGRAPRGGLARVDADCKVAWTSEVVAPTSVPKASLATGLVHVYEKRRNLWGVNAWYFTGIDARTGRTVFRSGLDMFVVGLGVAVVGYFVGDWIGGML